MQELSLSELEKMCIELGIIKPDPRNHDAVNMVNCTINKLYELVLRIK